MNNPEIRLLVLDRDGVINEDSPDFIKSVDEWLPLAGSIDAIASLSKAGFTIAVASNQSGLARGLFERATLAAMHDKLRGLVTSAGGCVDWIVYCPHGPNDGCDCRKPLPGLLQQIGDHFGMEMAGIPVIGDSLRDLEAALAIGARPILVRTGNGGAAARNLPPSLLNIEIYDDLAAAAMALMDG